MTIFGRTGFIAPGEPMNLILGVYVTTIVFVCADVAVARIARDAHPHR